MDNFLLRILESNQTLLPTLYLGGFPVIELDAYHVRAGRDLKDHHGGPAQNTNEEEMSKRRSCWLRAHSCSKAGAVKGIATQAAGPNLFPFHSIQLLTFVQRAKDSVLVFPSSQALIQSAKTSLTRHPFLLF